MHRHSQQLHNEKVPLLLIWIIIDSKPLLENSEKLIHDIVRITDSVLEIRVIEPEFLTGKLAGFRPFSEIIGKFRKLKTFYGHFVKRQK